MTVFQCDKCKTIMKEPALKISLCMSNKQVANKRIERDYCKECATSLCNCIRISSDNLEDLQEVEGNE